MEGDAPQTHPCQKRPQREATGRHLQAMGTRGAAPEDAIAGWKNDDVTDFLKGKSRAHVRA